MKIYIAIFFLGLTIFSSADAFSMDQKILNNYAGKYLASDGSYYVLQAERNHLKVQHLVSSTDSPYFYIYPQTKNKFKGGENKSLFTFINGKKGVSIVIINKGKKIRAWKMVPLRLNQ